MRKFFVFLVVLGVIIFLIFSLKIKKNSEVAEQGKTEVEYKRKKIQYIIELATAEQPISVGIDTSYLSTEKTEIELFGYKLYTWNEKTIKNRLCYLQRYLAKAGFKDISIYQKDSTFTVEALGPELLSFEMISDSVISEEGNFSKKSTAELELKTKIFAKNDIRQDSLFRAAENHFREYTKKLIESIAESKVSFIEYKIKNSVPIKRNID